LSETVSAPKDTGRADAPMTAKNRRVEWIEKFSLHDDGVVFARRPQHRPQFRPRPPAARANVDFPFKSALCHQRLQSRNAQSIGRLGEIADQNQDAGHCAIMEKPSALRKIRNQNPLDKPE